MSQDKKIVDMKINWEQAQAMAQRLTPPELIQQSLGLTPKQFQRAVRHVHKKSVQQWWDMYAAQGKAMIYQHQFEAAVKGSVTALKWMGKQHLGQTDKVETLFKSGENGSEEPKAAEVKGFSILTPAGMEPPKAGDGEAKQAHDEVPVVEQLLKKEAAEAEQPSAPPPAHVEEVPAYPENHEA